MSKTKQIVVCIEKWVYMGNVAPEKDTPPGYVRLTNASVVRVWGTTNGLGEIALNGPTPSTVLDPCGITDIPTSAVVARIHCVK